jgi:large subunit ribosomal protein L32
MAVPKRKVSKARRDKRRANWKMSLPGMSKCPQCHEIKTPHVACQNCGYYNGRQVIKSAAVEA